MSTEKLTYVGAYDAVDTEWGHARRGGDPVEFPADVAKDLVDRGDFARPRTKAAAEAADTPNVEPPADATPAPAEKE